MMKTKFPLLYRDVDEGVQNAFEKGFVVLDTNVILHVFRLGHSFCESFFDAIAKLGDRLVIPYCVAEEYHRNYESVVVEKKKHCQEALKNLKAAFAASELKSPLSCIDQSYQSCLNKEFKDEIQREFDEIIKKIENKFQIEEQRLAEEYKTRKILERLSDALGSHLCEPFTKEELQAIYEDGKKRYENKVPPGYKDRDKAKGNGDEYGDLVIWKEILKFAEMKADYPIVFVSDDVKEDWIKEIHGEKHGARQELMEEFSTKSRGFFDIVNTYTFIEKCLNLKSSDTMNENSSIDEQTVKTALAAVESYEKNQNSKEKMNYLKKTDRKIELSQEDVLSSTEKFESEEQEKEDYDLRK